MSKHVDLIAVGVLLLAFAFVWRLHDVVHLHIASANVMRVRPMSPFVVSPPHVPALPRLPHI
jgi:hypothetical protein